MRNSCYLSKYERNKNQAQEFANNRNETVYIAKAKKLNKYMIYFSKEEKTPNYEIIEEVKPE